MITVTNKAVQELKNLLELKNATPQQGLRLGVERGGCAGLQYTMQIADASEGDEVLDTDGTKVIVAADSLDHLKGCELDYSDALSDAGFKINNPNARRACGCGTSFETEESAPTDPAEDCK